MRTAKNVNPLNRDRLLKLLNIISETPSQHFSEISIHASFGIFRWVLFFITYYKGYRTNLLKKCNKRFKNYSILLSSLTKKLRNNLIQDDYFAEVGSKSSLY